MTAFKTVGGLRLKRFFQEAGGEPVAAIEIGEEFAAARQLDGEACLTFDGLRLLISTMEDGPEKDYMEAVRRAVDVLHAHYSTFRLVMDRLNDGDIKGAMFDAESDSLKRMSARLGDLLSPYVTRDVNRLPF